MIFVFLSIVFFISSISTNYSSERYKADKIYKIGDNYYEFLKHRANYNDNYEKMCGGGQKFTFECFKMKAYDFPTNNLGCLETDGSIKNLDNDLFISGVRCDKETGINCTFQDSVCGGDPKKIVSLQQDGDKVSFSFKNYLKIITNTLLVMIIWIILSYLIYYKGIIYTIFGRKEK